MAVKFFRLLNFYKEKPFFPDWLFSVSLIELTSLVSLNFTDNQTEIISQIFKFLTQGLITAIIVVKYLRQKEKNKNENDK